MSGAAEPPSAARRALSGLPRAAGRWLLALAIVAAATTWAAHRSILMPIDARVAALEEWRPLSRVEVVDKDGALIDTFAVQRREWRPLEEMAPVTWQAVVAAEDRRFFDHPGVDLLGIARAAWANYQAGEIEEGGSTLTQQMVKNLIVGDEESYARKAWEAVIAWRLDRRFSKERILEMYVNYVYLGDGNYGVEAAARSYFGVGADALNPAQAATLAGLIPAPTLYSPRNDPAEALQRRDQVLAAMAEEGSLTPGEARRWARTPILLAGEPGLDLSGREAYVTHVRREVRQRFEGRAPYRLGLRIQTAFDPELQAVAHQAVRDAVAGVMERQGAQGAVAHAEGEALDALLARPPEDLETGAVLAEPAAGDCFRAAYVGRQRLAAGDHAWPIPTEVWRATVRGDLDTPARALAQQARYGDVFEVCLDDAGQPRLSDAPWLDGAAVVLDNETGAIVALVGGIDSRLEGFNKATQARRQPGSSFKPYVYGAALAAGASATDTVYDGPLSLPGGNGRAWRPKNYGGSYSGRLPLRSALAASLNTVSVRLALDVGASQIRQLAYDLGVRTPLHENLTLALGSSEVTVLDQATAYSALARMGVALPASAIQGVQTLDGGAYTRGEALRDDGQLLGRLAPGAGQRALPAGVSRELVGMMEAVVRHGTGRRASRPDQARAGKTGTTNDNVDAWFVGFTPRHTVAVWVGADRAGLGDRETGSRAALPAWIAIADALPAEGTEAFALPDEAVQIPFQGEVIPVARRHVSERLAPRPDRDGAALPAFPGTRPLARHAHP